MSEKDLFFTGANSCFLYYLKQQKEGYLLFEVLTALSMLVISMTILVHYYGYHTHQKMRTHKQLATLRTVHQALEQATYKPLSLEDKQISFEECNIPIKIECVSFPVHIIDNFVWVLLKFSWSTTLVDTKRSLLTGYEKRNSI